MPFVFLYIFCVRFFLVFDLIFSTTTRPVQIFSSIEKFFWTFTFWVFFPSNRNKKDWKRKVCIIVWLVSIFKLTFLITFDCITPFGFGSILFANRKSLPRFWVFFPATRYLGAEITETFSHVSYLLVHRACYLNRLAFVSNLVDNWSFAWEFLR